MITFSLALEPVAKGRGRISGNRVFTPNKTRVFERAVKLLSKEYAPKVPLIGPLSVTIVFTFTRPKSVKREHPSVKPDLDNCIKAVTDALNGMMWVDDAQIVHLRTWKKYGATGQILIDITQGEV